MSASKFEPFSGKTEKEILENLKLLLEEKRRRSEPFDLKKFCHPKQHAFVSDKEPYVVALTSRRAGKTVGCAADLIHTALTLKDSVSLYITLSRVNAKILLWPILKKINQNYKLGGEPNESELSMKFKNRSMIYLSGVKDSSEIDKFRGMAIQKVYIDEAQSLPPYFKELIDDVLDPACIDHNGQIRVIGTPGAVPTGYFYTISSDPKYQSVWSRHFFTIWDNPFIHNAQERLNLALARRGVPLDDPSIQREYFGKWMADLSSLVIKYDSAINDYDVLPQIEWDYVISADFGYEDADAIAVLAYSTTHKCAYLVEEVIKTKQGITPLANQLNELITKYDPVKVLGDFGALGKKIAEELQVRFSIPIEAAEKTRKLEFIELLNDSLRTGRLKAKKESRFAQDAMLLEWDRDNPEKPKINDRYHSDIVDSVLYGHRELLHWLWEEQIPKPEPGTLADFKRQEEDAWDEVKKRYYIEKETEKFWRDEWSES